MGRNGCKCAFSFANVNLSLKWIFLQTSQDPTSPLAGTSNNVQLNASSAVADVRDGWDNEEWGSLEEDPVIIHQTEII